MGAMPGRSPISALVFSPRFTFKLLLSFSSLACEPSIINRNFSFGLFANRCVYVRISTKQLLIHEVDERAEVAAVARETVRLPT